MEIHCTDAANEMLIRAELLEEAPKVYRDVGHSLRELNIEEQIPG
jgi:hypothetical protein